MTLGLVGFSLTLVGWDDTKRAWLIQNSWGDNWGTKVIPEDWAIAGFMWIAWDSNSIGKYAAWVEAKIDDDSR